MKNEVNMEIDLRKHDGIREQVRAGIAAMRVQGRQIWGDGSKSSGNGGGKHDLAEVTIRLMVGVGDIARLTRDAWSGPINGDDHRDWQRQVKKELGNILFSTVRWIDDLGFDPLECLDLAVEAQEKFAASGRPR